MLEQTRDLLELRHGRVFGDQYQTSPSIADGTTRCVHSTLYRTCSLGQPQQLEGLRPPASVPHLTVRLARFNPAYETADGSVESSPGEASTASSVPPA